MADFKDNPWSGVVNFGSKNKEIKKSIFDININNTKKNDNFLIKIILLIFVLWIFSNTYYLNKNENSIEKVFGKFNFKTTSNIHYCLPYPFCIVEKINISDIRSNEYKYQKNNQIIIKEIGFFDVNLKVDWSIKNLKNFYLNIKDVDELIEDLSEYITRTTFLFVKDVKKLDKYENEILKNLQEKLDYYNSGIEIKNVKITKFEIIDELKSTIDNYKKIETEKNNIIENFNEYKNDKIKSAENDAKKIIEEGKNYVKEMELKTAIDKENMTKIYNEYKKNKELFKKINESILLEKTNNSLHNVEIINN